MHAPHAVGRLRRLLRVVERLLAAQRAVQTVELGGDPGEAGICQFLGHALGEVVLDAVHVERGAERVQGTCRDQSDREDAASITDL